MTNAGVLAFDPKKIPDPAVLDGGLTFNVVSVRVRAALALQAYGELLIAVVDDSQQAELQSATNAFTKSLRGFDPEKAKVSDDQLSAFGDLVQTIGGWWVESSRKQALVSVIPAADLHIKEVCNIFAAELDAKGPLAAQVDARGQLALRVASYVLENKQSSLQDRQAAAHLSQQAAALTRKAETICPQLHRSAKQLMAAHADLVAVMGGDSRSLDDLRDFAAGVQVLLSAAAVLSESQ